MGTRAIRGTIGKRTAVLTAALLLCSAAASAADVRAKLVLAKESAAVFEPVQMRLRLTNAGTAPLAVLRYHPQVGYNGAIAATVIEPDGREMAPFRWRAQPPALDGRPDWGQRPEDYLILQPGDIYYIDLTSGFFSPARDPVEAPRQPAFPITPFGARYYPIFKAGTHRIAVRYAPQPPLNQVQDVDVWSGELETDEARLTIEARKYPGGRMVGYTKRAARGPKMTCTAASYFGGAGMEEFIGVGQQADGTIVAVGNAWQQVAPPGVRPRVLGQGQWLDVSPFRDGQAVVYRRGVVDWNRLDDDYPNRAGFFVRFSGDLQRVLDVTRFDWGVAHLREAQVRRDGRIVVTGQGLPAFRDLARRCDEYHEVETPGDARDTGWYEYQGVSLPGDTFVACMSADLKRLEWVWLFAGRRQVPRIYVDVEGGVTVDLDGFKYIDPSGRSMQEVPFSGGSGRVGVRAVSAYNRHVIRGGDRNTSTGMEPWRQPLCYYYNERGECQFEVYSWHSRLVGQYRLVSDSSIRGGAFLPDGRVWLYGWSDGGNTVFERDPVDLDRGVPHDPFGMSLWGAGVGSFSHLMRLNPETYEVDMKVTLGSFFMKESKEFPGKFNDKANSLNIKKMLPMSNGGLALTGASASYLVQTPDPWYQAADWDWRALTAPGGRGAMVMVFDPEVRWMLWSSALPATDPTALAETRDGGLVVCARTTGMRARNTAWGRRFVHQYPRVINAFQPEYGGGLCDGFVLLLSPPK